jgi:hypothetical protein
MAHLTTYYILAFSRGADGVLRQAGTAHAPSKEAAVSQAAAMIGQSSDSTGIIGAAVCAQTMDPRVPNLAELAIVGRYGLTP